MSISPGNHVVTIGSFTELEDRVIAHMLTKQGQTITQNLGIVRGSGKSISLKIFDDYFAQLNKKGQRSLRNRHHNRKEQPNCGPRKPNQW